MDEDECEMLLKAVGKVEGQCLRTLTYYKSVLEGGEATDKQTKKLYQAEEDFESIESIKNVLLAMIKRKRA